MRNKTFISTFLSLSIFITTTGFAIEISTDTSDLVELIKVNPNVQIEIWYATPNNFVGEVLYDSPKCYLRKTVAQKLDLIQKELEPLGFGLKVWDGYRPYSVQKKMWAIMPVPGLVAPPIRGSNHNRGAAVDLTIVDLNTGQELKMPTPFDELTERASRNYTKGISKEALRNSLFLGELMIKHGFTLNSHEWWHFDDKNCKAYPILDVNFSEL